MKSIKIATGVKKIDLSSQDVRSMMKVAEVLKEHRNVLIDRMLKNLTTYIDYQFKVKPTALQIEQISNALIALSNTGSMSSRYDDLVAQIFSEDYVVVSSEPFYLEINEIIDMEMRPSQLALVR